MKICLDTNVIIDILGKTDDFQSSFAAVDIAIIRHFQVFISITSTPDIAYLMPRRNLATEPETRQLLTDMFSLLGVLDARPVDATQALNSGMPDYEDALIAQIAQRNGIELILTRNISDSQRSPVAVMSPQEFVDIYKPKDVEYTTIDLAPGV